MRCPCLHSWGQQHLRRKYDQCFGVSWNLASATCRVYGSKTLYILCTLERHFVMLAISNVSLFHSLYHSRTSAWWLRSRTTSSSDVSVPVVVSVVTLTTTALSWSSRTLCGTCASVASRWWKGGVSSPKTTANMAFLPSYVDVRWVLRCSACTRHMLYQQVSLWRVCTWSKKRSFSSITVFFFFFDGSRKAVFEERHTRYNFLVSVVFDLIHFLTLLF